MFLLAFLFVEGGREYIEINILRREIKELIGVTKINIEKWN
ncbi:hypothetical protein [Paramaledivibacter caminithermalis]|jgi:hypothetical protein|nr:hypothetical protein [Paramaledivibacter caminithermalis]